jgi:hypothetical protein
MRRNRCVRLIEIQVNNSKPFNTNCVYDSNFFFTRSRPEYSRFFATHFLICHSFLDSHIVHDLARKAKGKIWRETWAGRPGWNSRTVAQYPKPSAQSRSHVTTQSRLNLGHMSQPNRGSISVTCHNPSRSHVTNHRSSISVTCHNPQPSHKP